MNWSLKDSGVSRPKDLPDRIDRRLRCALSRFAGWIDKVVVFLHDHHGPTQAAGQQPARSPGCDRGCAAPVPTAAFPAGNKSRRTFSTASNGDADKVCRVLVKARGCGVIMAAVTDADWRAAVDRATAAIGRSVARQIRRCRDSRRTTSTRPMWPAEPARGG